MAFNLKIIGVTGTSAFLDFATYDPTSSGSVALADAVDGASTAGPDKYYGTDNAGTTGFYNLGLGLVKATALDETPGNLAVKLAGGSGIAINPLGTSITNDVLIVEIAGLSAAPSNTYFGLDAAGNEGFFAFPSGSGSGDMLTTTYDTSASGVVDEAESLSGAPTTGQVWTYDGTNQLWAAPAGGGGGGTGDMLQSVYDTNASGIVDFAEEVDGAGSAGNDQYYGTNSSGTVGFYSLPAGGGGVGDMTKAVYDTTDNGIVDEAESLAGAPTAGQVWGFDGTSQGFITPAGGGSGDMTQAVYDTNASGVVDLAEALDGAPTVGQVWGFDGTSQGFITPTGGGTALLRQEATPSADLNTLWLKPSNAKLHFYDPGSDSWISIN